MKIALKIEIKEPLKVCLNCLSVQVKDSFSFYLSSMRVLRKVNLFFLMIDLSYRSQKEGLLYKDEYEHLQHQVNIEPH